MLSAFLLLLLTGASLIAGAFKDPPPRILGIDPFGYPSERFVRQYASVRRYRRTGL